MNTCTILCWRGLCFVDFGEFAATARDKGEAHAAQMLAEEVMLATQMLAEEVMLPRAFKKIDVDGSGTILTISLSV